MSAAKQIQPASLSCSLVELQKQPLQLGLLDELRRLDWFKPSRFPFVHFRKSFPLTANLQKIHVDDRWNRVAIGEDFIAEESTKLLSSCPSDHASLLPSLALGDLSRLEARDRPAFRDEPPFGFSCRDQKHLSSLGGLPMAQGGELSDRFPPIIKFTKTLLSLVRHRSARFGLPNIRAGPNVPSQVTKIGLLGVPWRIRPSVFVPFAYWWPTAKSVQPASSCSPPELQTVTITKPSTDARVMSLSDGCVPNAYLCPISYSPRQLNLSLIFVAFLYREDRKGSGAVVANWRNKCCMLAKGQMRSK